MSAQLLTKILDELKGLRDDIKSLEQTIWDANTPGAYDPPKHQNNMEPSPQPKKMTMW